MFQIAILASGNGTNLQAILDAKARGELEDVEITKVLSDKADSKALDKAKAAGVPGIFVDPAGQSPDKYDETLISVLGDVDLVCLVGYLRILTPIFIYRFEGKIINVHPSLLPKYGGKGFYGKHVHQAVLDNGDAETGMTIHTVTEEVDAGKILRQDRVAVEAGDTVESLTQKVQALEQKAYPEVIGELAKAEQN